MPSPEVAFPLSPSLLSSPALYLGVASLNHLLLLSIQLSPAPSPEFYAASVQHAPALSPPNLPFPFQTVELFQGAPSGTPYALHLLHVHIKDCTHQDFIYSRATYNLLPHTHSQTTDYNCLSYYEFDN